MNWTQEIRAFIVQHKDDDTDRLLLSAHRYADIDMPFVVDQILARKQIKNKLPEWSSNDNIIMGGRVPAEQCSSEQTAKYKRSLVVGDSLCDMTGGMGVDLYYMSQGLTRAIYTERQHHLCEASAHNFVQLGAHHIETREGDGRELPIPDVDTIYLDPARRAVDGSRVYDLADCEPNVVEWQDELLSHCKRLVVKISPMADITKVIKLMPKTTELHVVAAKGECKEVIVVCDNEKTIDDIKVFCIDFKGDREIKYQFSLAEESGSESTFAEKIGKYLYEPDVAVLKSGAFKSLCAAFNIYKLDVNSHLYTSEDLKSDFPGRIFTVAEQMPFASKTIKQLKKNIPQANITARNFVMTADVLRSRSGIKDGGDVYLFASSLKGAGNILIKCRKVLITLFCLVFCLSSVFAKDDAKALTIEHLLSNIRVSSPSVWHQGKEFYFLNSTLNMTLVQENHVQENDTIDYRGSLWTFDALVSEEDWMGQQTMALRFISPFGKKYRFSTDRLMAQVADTTYYPTIPGLYPKDIIEKIGDVLCARTLYILINDDRVADGDSLKFEKYVPVKVDSVSYGTEIAPITIFYTYENGKSSFVKTSLPGTKENATSTPINKFFSIKNPQNDYPEITSENWKMIQHSEVSVDMTKGECRLSWGKPMRAESYNTRNGLVERWIYSGNRVLEFWGGRLYRVGREK